MGGLKGTMNENLTQMVKQMETGASSVFPVDNIDIPPEVVEIHSNTTMAAIDGNASSSRIQMVVQTVSLSEWFEINASKFSNINQVKVAIRGVDARKTLIMAVKDESKEKDAEGNDKRVLRVFEDADIHPVLNLAGMDMQIYNNGFRIINDINGTIFAKCYGIRTGLIIVFCNAIFDKLVPYEIVRIKKGEKEVIVPQSDIATITAKLSEQCDKEALQLLYKQISKSVNELTTKQSVVDWFVEKQKEVTDINHHLQIDQVIIDILK
jgi:hypothetical protein